MSRNVTDSCTICIRKKQEAGYILIPWEGVQKAIIYPKETPQRKNPTGRTVHPAYRVFMLPLFILVRRVEICSRPPASRPFCLLSQIRRWVRLNYPGPQSERDSRL